MSWLLFLATTFLFLLVISWQQRYQLQHICACRVTRGQVSAESHSSRRGARIIVHGLGSRLETFQFRYPAVQSRHCGDQSLHLHVFSCTSAVSSCRCMFICPILLSTCPLVRLYGFRYESRLLKRHIKASQHVHFLGFLQHIVCCNFSKHV